LKPAIEKINSELREERKRIWSAPEKIPFGIYPTEGFARYQGSISEIGEYEFSFDGIKVWISPTDSLLKDILRLGIIYPNVFQGNTTGDKIIPRPLTSEDSQSVFFNCMRLNRIGISLTEMTSETDDVQTKKFKVWVQYSCFANPREYYIELNNLTVDQCTDMKTFLKGATLVFIKGGWIII